MSALPSPPIRVVIVDDAVVVRHVLREMLSAEDDIEIVGIARNGQLGIETIRATKPDLVVMDIEMPVMDGLTALGHVRSEWPRLPVIMCSTLTSRGASATLDALARGATDYVTKPESVSGPNSVASLRADLVGKVRGLGRRRATALRSLSDRPAPPVVRRAPRPKPLGPIEVVALAISTGGPQSLMRVIPQLPADLPVPIVAVQHMPPVFTALLAERLDRESGIHVVEATPGCPVEPGTMYLAPGGKHMVVARGSRSGVHLELNEDPPENSCRPAADPLFRSVADVYGAHTLAVVMTGMGADGCRGSEHIDAAGGTVVIQDEATSVVWGMPGAVARTGLAVAECPLDSIAAEITTRVRVGRPAGASAVRPVRVHQ